MRRLFQHKQGNKIYYMEQQQFETITDIFRDTNIADNFDLKKLFGGLDPENDDIADLRQWAYGKGVSFDQFDRAYRNWREPAQCFDERYFGTLKTAAEMTERDVPDREYLLDGWLPVGCVSTLFGDGGQGKSLVAMQMASAVASGKTLWNCQATKAPVLAFYCEDDEDELSRRQQSIARSLSLSPADQCEYYIQSRFGMDSSLGHFDRGRWSPSDLLSAIGDKARETGARLVIIDNINMVFNGDANDAGQVTRFMSALNKLALSINGVVLLLGHTSKAEGSKYAGSTSWSNASRNRLYLGRPDNSVIASKNPDLRHLVIEKSNYGQSGEALELLWHFGAFVLPSDVDQEGKATQEQQRDEQIFLRHLKESTTREESVSAKAKARNYAPRVFAHRRAEGCNHRSIHEMERAMGRLLTAGTIADDQPLGWKTEQRKPAKGLALVAQVAAPVLNDVLARNQADELMDNIRVGAPTYQASQRETIAAIIARAHGQN
ncbi:AAA family ATPase [Sphingopyxis sp. SCN 67-31]|uniref:AAA family ATPase n=1 Tax=Sphingopyxis sp. SCN 67-31 TaxID=1660142 RepID=UPI00257BCF0B|nr:AAA family ATPase [Sphingopyxis sp. SCN 67-31]